MLLLLMTRGPADNDTQSVSIVSAMNYSLCQTNQRRDVEERGEIGPRLAQRDVETVVHNLTESHPFHLCLCRNLTTHTNVQHRKDVNELLSRRNAERNAFINRREVHLIASTCLRNTDACQKIQKFNRPINPQSITTTSTNPQSPEVHTADGMAREMQHWQP